MNESTARFDPLANEAGDEIDPLALALFGLRDHIRHHPGCSDRRGIAGHHYDEADECALRDIVKRYGDACALGASAATEREAGR